MVQPVWIPCTWWRSKMHLIKRLQNVFFFNFNFITWRNHISAFRVWYRWEIPPNVLRHMGWFMFVFQSDSKGIFDQLVFIYLAELRFLHSINITLCPWKNKPANDKETNELLCLAFSLMIISFMTMPCCTHRLKWERCHHQQPLISCSTTNHHGCDQGQIV